MEELLAGRCDNEYDAVTAVYNDSCDTFATEEQLYGEDDWVSAATDWWQLAHQLACGLLVSPRHNPPAAPHVALAHAIETLELDISRPKA